MTGSCRSSCVSGSPGCGCSRACRSPTSRPTANCCRPSRSGSSTSTGAWTDALVRARSAWARSTPQTASQLESCTSRSGPRSTRRSGGSGWPAARASSRVAGTITGFLLRSRAVTGWPGLHVRAYDGEPATGDNAIIPECDPRRLKVLRMERLAPAVLLVLFDGVPADRAHRGTAAGRPVRRPAGRLRRRERLRAWIPAGTRPPPRRREPPDSRRQAPIDVPFRPGAPGVLDLTAPRREASSARRPS